MPKKSNFAIFGRIKKWIFKAATKQNHSDEITHNTTTQTNKLQRANQLITALSHVVAQVDASSSPEEVMETLGQELSQIGIICVLSLVDHKTEALIIRYTSIAPNIQTVTKKTIGRDITGFHLHNKNWPFYEEIIEHNRTIYRKKLLPVLFDLIPHVPQPVASQLFKLIGVSQEAAAIHLPLRVKKQVLGALILIGESIFEEDLSIFTIFASQIAAAIKNANQLAEISKSESQFRGLFESSPDGVVIIDENGRIVLINTQAENLFQYQQSELVDRPVEILVPKSSRKFHTVHRKNYANDPQRQLMGRNLRLTAQRKDGSHFPAEISLSPLKTNQANLIISTIRDITPRIIRERQLELLNEIISNAAANHSEEALLQAGCTAVANYFSVPQVAIALIDNTNTHEIVVAEHLDEGRPSAMNVKIPISGNAPLHKVISSGKPVAIADVHTNPITAPIRDIMQARGTHSMLLVPIPVKGQIVGTMGIDDITPRNFTEEETKMAQIVAEELGRALETSRLYKQLQSHAAELEEKVDIRTKELKAANLRLQELDKLKSKLVSDVSHELRTPITALSMYLKLLESGKPERRHEYLQILHSETKRISHLVENILDLSRLEMMQNREIGMEMIDLNEIIEQVVTVHLPRAEAENLDLQFAPHKNLPLIYGERNQIAQVVTNLIANALNYTKSGTIQVQTCVAENGDVYLQVADTGMGIEAADLGHIFERFYRGQQQGDSNVPGTGLGLGIVREIVNLHQGKIEVSSKVGEGSTFKIIFPQK